MSHSNTDSRHEAMVAWINLLESRILSLEIKIEEENSLAAELYEIRAKLDRCVARINTLYNHFDALKDVHAKWAGGIRG